MQPSAYAELADRFRRISAVQGAVAILDWDAAVMLPKGASAGRGEQFATLSGIAHEMLTADGLEARLDAAERADLEPWQRANVREMRQRRKAATAVPQRLVEELARATNACEMAWRDARAASDFKALTPLLDDVVRLVREQAGALGAALGLEPYDALLNQYEAGLRGTHLDELLGPLPTLLAPLVEAAVARSPEPIDPAAPIPVEKQRALGRLLLEKVGFDFAHGRLDESTHPFCGGVSDDVRLTTRYGDGPFLQALFGILHEAGHALYSQGLPADRRLQPVGEARGMVVHESQSLLMEMQVSRGPAFLAYLSRLLVEMNGPDPAFTSDALAARMRRVERSLIRVEADEVTYPLHIVLRWRLERALLSGDLATADLPGAWNQGMRELLGITPPDDRRGCLQDIHWPVGALGYFPCYTLGAMLAAQLAVALRNDLPDLDAQIASGDFAGLLGWLRTTVHQHGRLYDWNELTTRATGRTLHTEPFLTHLRGRYLGAT